jgi:poly(rC)-binding protein 2/3/4
MPDDPFSKAQKAVMIIHSKILFSDRDKDGIVNTKLLVPADQAGCLLGRGGHIMIEMRKMTRAKIHIHGKEGLPPCAPHTDELVEVSYLEFSCKHAKRLYS